jgi:hypothetical protein
MKKLSSYFNRKSSTGKQKPENQDLHKTKEDLMQTQAALNNPVLPVSADFPSPGALTPGIMAALWEMVHTCRNIARQAEDKGDLKTALAAIKETHRLLMNLAKLEAARLKAQQNQPAAQTAAPEPSGSARTGQTQAASPVSPAAEQGQGRENNQGACPPVSGMDPGEAKPAPAQPNRQGWPPNARGITNLGNYVY